VGSSKYLHWFDTSTAMRPVTEGNLTDFFTTGEEAFADLADRLEFDAGKEASAYLLGWSCDVNVALRTTPSPVGTTLGQLLAYFAKQGGVVHGMLWDNTLMAGAGCADAVKHINSLPGGSSAILDHRTPLAGSHHQKIQIVVPARSHITEDASLPLPAIAYCGGMDVFGDRIGPGGLHDVHCKIRGPAADDLVKVFQDRWNDHPDRTADLTARTSAAGAGGSSLVQVCSTYPMFQSPLIYSLLVNHYLPAVNQELQGSGAPTAGDMRDNGSTRLYGFYDTSKGVQQIWRAVKKAISEAKSYIYLEDQYLTHKWVGDALAAKLAATLGDDFRIVIVVLHPDFADIEQMWPRRRDVFAKLLAADPRRKRWTVVHRRADKPHPYVHSKTWIFDDELVITGSANADRRGYTYNSETDVVVAGDVSTLSPVTSGATTIAQDLRARLFAKHLGGKPADHLQPAASLRKWFGDLSKTSVAVFNPSAQVGAPDKYVAKLQASAAPLVQGALNFMPGRPEDWLWDYLEDPDADVHEP
jgi:phosphatidylserine/phosphatidylglycerophosphate/cardiolipin synthase-like enzyme